MTPVPTPTNGASAPIRTIFRHWSIRLLGVLLLLLSPFLMSPSVTAEEHSVDNTAALKQAILERVDSFSRTWNSGDMTGYLAHYRPDAEFGLLSSGGELYGIEPVREVFTSTWDTAEAMGQFHTSAVDVRVLTPTVAVARGQFEHHFIDHTVIGNFTLVWQHFADTGWQIVQEHTARKRVIEHPAADQ